MNETVPAAKLRRAQFDEAQKIRAWFLWDVAATVELTRFRTKDVPELLDKPWTVEGLRIAERAAHTLFPERRLPHPAMADRWNRFVGQAFRNIVGGEWVNAPAWIEGDRHDGVLPAVLLPHGRFLLPLLPAVLAAPPGAIGHGEVLTTALHTEKANHWAWQAAGRPDPLGF